ncbi:MAG TPA: plastocyanin/azurin family copper-binding protein [Flavobacteriales bacterium]|nr:plastocyanin/azurin family copper-binding protein [Flavobacteriales bacterium]
MNTLGSRVAPLVPVMVLLLLASCGGPEAPAATEPAPAAHVPTSVAVSIAQMKFNPDTVRVHAGDTIVWTNNDVVDHDATALPDSAWTSGVLHPGDSWRFVAQSSTPYFCSIHVVMQGQVQVEQE